jgi:hypothetical protein
MDSTRREPDGRAWMRRAAGPLAAALIFAGGLAGWHRVSREASIGEAMCHALLDNSTAGRQALVSSAWWPPLPTLARLLLAAAMPDIEGWPVPSLLLGAACGVGVVMLLLRTLARLGAGRIRYAFAAALAAHPAFVDACLDGSNTALLMLLAVLAAGGLAGWLARGGLRHLVGFAAGAGLIAGSSIALWPWIVLAFALIALDQAFDPASRAHKEAVLILAALPALSMAALWCLMNWLIMGDPFYFLRSIPLRAPASAAAALGAITRPHLAAAAAAAAALAVGLVRRDKPAAAAGLVGALPLAVAILLADRGLLWSPSAELALLAPLAILALAVLPGGRGRGRGSAVAAAAAAGLALFAWFAPGAADARAPASDGFAGTIGERNTWRPRIESHVRRQSRHAVVFVCGYDGFGLVGPRGRSPFVHALDFDFQAAERDYHGCALFLLVPEPSGRSGAESLYWKFPGLYELGTRNTLYNGDWGRWRLYEVVQAPR